MSWLFWAGAILAVVAGAVAVALSNYNRDATEEWCWAALIVALGTSGLGVALSWIAILVRNWGALTFALMAFTAMVCCELVIGFDRLVYKRRTGLFTRTGVIYIALAVIFAVMAIVGLAVGLLIR